MKQNNILSRKRRVRAKIKGNASIPRLSVNASLKHITAQLIDDESGQTIAHISDLKITEKKSKVARAENVGSEIAVTAKKAGIKKVVFDRGSKLYHGRIKALADAARGAGLEF